jgi:hypothetical protein
MKTTSLTIYKIIILLLGWYGRETWSLTLRERHKVNVFENRVLKRRFCPNRKEWYEDGENYIMRSFITCTHHEA